MKDSAMTSDTAMTLRISPDVIESVEVAIEAYVGGARMTVGALGALAKDDVVRLDATLGRDVELRLNGVTIATGELVAVEDNFAVRITAISGH